MDKNNTANEPTANYEQPLNFEKVWAMFQDVAERFRETDKQFKETDRKFQETDKQFKETDKQFKATDKRINKLNDLFTSQWGKLIESLVEGDLIALLNAKGIMVERTQERVKGIHNGNPYEFDIIAGNGLAVVVVEVKTTLRPNDVKHFKAKLQQIKTLISDYEHKIIYGAMAYLKADAGSATMAENQGLFIIKATGSSASIANRADFKPKAF